MEETTTPYQQRMVWLMRFFYFTGLGGTGFIAPFLNVFFTRQGLTGTEIGVIASAASLVTLISAPLWASESARRGKSRQVLQWTLILSGMIYLWLSQQTLFWGLLIINALRALFNSGVGPLSDSLAVSVTGATRSGFGSVRVWASLGWTVIVLLSGWLIQHTGFHSAFIGVFLMQSVGALALFWVIPAGQRRGAVAAEPKTPISLKGMIRRALTDRSLVAVGLLLVAIGLGNSGVAQFESVFLDQLGASESLIGIASMVSAVVEIPCMLWSDQLVRRYGPRRLLLVSMVMYVALRGMVLLSPSIITIIAGRAIGGICFSFYTVGLIRYISMSSTPEERGTALALFTVTLGNLIGIAATPLAGYAFDLVGARWLYPLAMGGYALGWVSMKWLARKDTLPA